MLQFALLGLGAGGVYALSGQSLVLIYRGSGVVNFASGGMAIVGAFACYRMEASGLPAVPALLLGTICTAIVGAATHVVIMRNIKRPSPLVCIVATLGLLTALQGASLLAFGANTQLVASPLPHRGVRLLGTAIGADQLYLAAISAAVALALWAVYRFSAFGLATSAVAESPRAAASLGRSPDVIATINWGLGGALAGLAGILIAPVVGLSVAQLGDLLVPALAAALVGRFSSFGLTFAGGLFIGVAQSELLKYVASPGWPDSVPLLVIVAALALRGRTLPIRGELHERLPAVGTGAAPRAWVLVAIAGGAAAVGLAGAGLLLALTTACIAGVIGLSVVVVTGYTGQLSLAQYAFAGCGAFVSARLSATTGMPFPLAALVGIASTVPLGLLVGVPSLRTRGASLGIATLAIAVVFTNVVLGNPDYSGGLVGTKVRTPALFGLSIDPIAYPRRYAWLSLASLTFAALLVANLRRGRIGRRLIAIRGNERAAAALGLRGGPLKLYGFCLAAGLAGLGGVLMAFEAPSVTFTGFGIGPSIQIVVVVVVAGIGFVAGALVGAIAAPSAVAAYALGHLTNSEALLALISGIVLTLTLIIAPDGMIVFKLGGLRSIGRAGRIFARRVPVLRRTSRGARPVGRATSLPTTATAADVRRNARRRTLAIEELSVRFGAVVALDGVSLEVHPGEVVGLIGPNGAGKTTLIDAVTGVTRPSAGRVLLDGHDLGHLGPAARARRGVSRTFQSLELFDDLPVGDNLRVACDRPGILAYLTELIRPRAVPLPPEVASVLRALRLQDELDHRPDQLSFAHRRLVAIARAVAGDPAVLLVDEPGAGLDGPERRALADVLRRVATEWGVGVLLIEHDVELVLAVCDRVAVLASGRLIATGTPNSIRAEKAVVTAFVGADSPVADPQTVGTDSVATGMDPIPSLPSKAPGTTNRVPRPGALLLQARDLSAGYGRPVLNHVDLEVRAGEVVALLGANGAGKTTTLLALAGEIAPAGGEITWCGHPLRGSLSRRARVGIGLVTDERSVFMGLTASQNLRVGRGAQLEVLRLFPDLEPHLGRRAGLLSGGQQRMLSLGRALAASPRLLMADELSLGLAPKTVSQLLQAVRDAADHGIGILLVEQHISQALAVADRAYVLARGRVVLSGQAAELRGRIGEIEAIYFPEQVALNSESGNAGDIQLCSSPTSASQRESDNDAKQVEVH